MEKLTAALPSSASLMPLSDQQFQDMLSAWFEEKGIMSDLRSQARYKMINVLRNTVIGRDICKRSSQTVSLSKQAINLVVAEHLMQNKYQYSLSIFNTEASLTNMFPEFGYKSLNELESNPFNRENILNVLELVGISKNSKICQEILKLYYKERKDKSLLECLITWLSEVTTLKRPGPFEIDSKLIDLSNDTNFVKQIANFLANYDLSLGSFKSIIEKVRILHSLEIQNLERHFLNQIDLLKQELHFQEQKIRDIHKAKKSTEIKLAKTLKEYDTTKTQLKKLSAQKNFVCIDKEIQTNVLFEHRDRYIEEANTCSLMHCTATCTGNSITIKELANQNQELRKQNLQQKGEIATLKQKYDDLLKSLGNCQKKIGLLHSRMNEEDVKAFVDRLVAEEDLKVPEVKLERKTEAISDSSESVTEEILREARLRLKILEEESKEMEEKCFSYLVK